MGEVIKFLPRYSKKSEVVIGRLKDMHDIRLEVGDLRNRESRNTVALKGIRPWKRLPKLKLVEPDDVFTRDPVQEMASDYDLIGLVEIDLHDNNRTNVKRMSGDIINVLKSSKGNRAVAYEQLRIARDVSHEDFAVAKAIVEHEVQLKTQDLREPSIPGRIGR